MAFLRTVLLVFVVLNFEIYSISADGPCTRDSLELTCTDVHSGFNIRQALSVKPAIAVIIANTSGTIPLGIFAKSKKVKELGLKNVTLSQSISEGALNGLENETDLLEIRDVSGLSGWKWKAFSKLRVLSKVTIERSEFPDVSADFSDLTSGSVFILNINYCGVRCIDDWAFANFVNAIVIDLSSNAITELRREMFPKNGKLKRLHLDNNKISHLEELLFVDLPNLDKIYLNENRLKMIWQKSFGSVQNFHLVVFLDGNPMMCDCGMKFLQVTLFGTCRIDQTLYEINSFLHSENCSRFQPNIQQMKTIN